MAEPSVALQLSLTMLSDWHVGTGAGRPGSVDRLVARDDDSLPYVPAKSLTGVWRDACERVAAGLDGGPDGRWSEWVNRIFGDQPALPESSRHDRPRPAALEVRAARMPDTLAGQLRGDHTGDERRALLREALTFVKPGVKIDSRSGRALDRHLRFIEMGRVNTVLTSRATLALPPEARDAALALLVAGSLLVERVGGKRRRGAGRCRLQVGGVAVPEPAKAIAWLEDHEPPSLPADAQTAAVTVATDPGEGEWLAIPYELRLETPAVVAACKVGNVVETLDHVPGTLLLPHFTRSLAALGIDARPSIARGDLRVLPATLAVGGHPGRPVPQSWHRPKRAATTNESVINLVSGPAPADVQLKAVRDGWIGAAGAAGTPIAKVHTIATTHNVVEDQSQRPTAEVGGVYTYEAIAPCTLAGRILVRASLERRIAAAPNWRKSLSGRCRVGRSKKDDYGAATFTITADPSALESSPSPGPRLVVWLESDVLLRDGRLRPETSIAGLGRALARALDPDGSRRVELSPVEGDRPAFARVRRTESWQQSWGLPRPSLVGLQAGSCLVFAVTGSLTAADLARVQAAGLGERTAEGYGQVSFDDPLVVDPGHRLIEVQHSRDAGKAQSSAGIAPQDPAYAFAKTIEEQAWRELLRRKALAAGGHVKEFFEWESGGRNPKPPMSQLGGLRSAISGVTDDAGKKRAVGWLDHLSENGSRVEKWPSGRGGLDRIRELLTKPARVWELLDKADPTPWPTLTADGDDTLRELLWPVAVRSLVQASIRACKRARDAKKRKQTNAPKGGR